MVACADVKQVLRLVLTAPPGDAQSKIYPRSLGLVLDGSDSVLLLEAAKDRYRAILGWSERAQRPKEARQAAVCQKARRAAKCRI